MKKLRNMLCSGIASAMLLSALPVHAANMVTTTDGHGESETVEETVRCIWDINVTKATNYAKKYANNPNSSYKYYSGADCTNFASQIAYAGGLRYAPVWQPYTKPWINANFFGIVWGKKGKSTKWSTFVKQLIPGMFIAADFGGDGALDHVAYVAANGSSSSNKYIAQHTANYYLRSDSNKSNWKNDTASRVLWIIGNNGS